MQLSCGACGNDQSVATTCGHGCMLVFYCGQECADNHYDVHSTQCLGAVVGAVTAESTAYQRMPFYAASKALWKQLRGSADIFTWLCLQSFMTTPIINDMIFAQGTKGNAGNWFAFDNRFADVYKSKARVRAVVNPTHPYTIFETFFKTMLLDAATNKRPLTAPQNRRAVITTQKSLLKYYPQLQPYFEMKNSDFTRAYARAIQNAIMSIPTGVPRQKTVFGFRGYTPLNIPYTWSLNVDRLVLGRTITNWSFMSISLDKRISAGFTDTAVGCCMMKVRIPHDFPVFLLSSDAGDVNYNRASIVAWPPQQEILLPAGVRLKVTKLPGKRKYTASDGKTVVVTNVVEVLVVGLAEIKM
jgi:hypothetical protein